MRTRRGLVVLLAAAVLLLPAFAPVPVRAAFPGTNGPIAWWFLHPTETGGIRMMQPDGTVLGGFLPGRQPAVSPDGGRIAFSGDTQLFVADLDGSDQQELWAGEGGVWDIDWSPDATHIVFGGCTGYQCNDDALYVAHADGTGVSAVFTGSTFGSAWSPHGTRIAYAAAGVIYLMNPDGSGSEAIRNDVPGYPPYVDLTWSPDGTQIAYGTANDWGDPGQIWVMNSDGSAAHYLAPGRDPSWSPDGTMMAYVCSYQICVMNADGTDPHQLTTTTEGWNREPFWGSSGLRYDFTGFFAPVDNGATNVAKAGSAIPVKFSLGGDQGLDIFAACYPKAIAVTCDSGEVLDTIETYAAGASGLQYDEATGQYTYVWKTQKAWKGCYEFQMKLADGSAHIADFKFK